jgi:glycosidase
MKKIIKRSLLLFLVLFSLLIGFFAYVNLRQETEPLPEIVATYGEEARPADRPWWQGTTVYQIYPRSFQDSDGDGIGDLAGIISRLDYLKEMGFETLWFSPFFKSPQQDIGYDISDYYAVDPPYGDSLLLDSLIREVHRREMKLVFDLVLNHSSDQHPWFVESRSSRDNPKADWYVWRDGKEGGPPTNWHSALGSNGWHYAPERDQWYYSAFLPFQPDLNYHNPEVKQAMLDMVRHWLDRGVDGFRLDIFNFLYEDPDFHDNPSSLRYLPSIDMVKMNGQERINNLNRPETFAFAKELRSLLDSYEPARFMVGEVFGRPSHLKQLLGEENDGLNLVFNFDLTHFKWEAAYFRERLRSYEAFYPYPFTPTAVFSNHDLPRSIGRIDNDPEWAKVLATLQFSTRAVPFTYQGEEIGMTTGEIPLAEAKDSLAHYFLRSFPAFLTDAISIFYNRDNCRTPMQWSADPKAGFCPPEVTPWLPVQDNHSQINVATAQADSNSLLHTYRELLTLRRREDALRWGSLRLLEGPEWPEEVLAYERVFRDQRLRIALNLSEKRQLIPQSGEVLFLMGEWEEETGALGGKSALIWREEDE